MKTIELTKGQIINVETSESVYKYCTTEKDDVIKRFSDDKFFTVLFNDGRGYIIDDEEEIEVFKKEIRFLQTPKRK